MFRADTRHKLAHPVVTGSLPSRRWTLFTGSALVVTASILTKEHCQEARTAPCRALLPCA